MLLETINHIYYDYQWNLKLLIQRKHIISEQSMTSEVFTVSVYTQTHNKWKQECFWGFSTPKIAFVYNQLNTSTLTNKQQNQRTFLGWDKVLPFPISNSFQQYIQYFQCSTFWPLKLMHFIFNGETRTLIHIFCFRHFWRILFCAFICHRDIKFITDGSERASIFHGLKQKCWKKVPMCPWKCSPDYHFMVRSSSLKDHLYSITRHPECTTYIQFTYLLSKMIQSSTETS